jgi:hypothetical protein
VDAGELTRQSQDWFIGLRKGQNKQFPGKASFLLSDSR